MRIAALALCLSGCSFLFVDGPPIGYEDMAYFQCTESKVAPGADTFAALFDVVMAAGYYSRASDAVYMEDAEQLESAGALAIGAAAIWAASAIYGFSNVGQCIDAKTEIANRSAHSSGCTKDTDCKGDRICVAGVCGRKY